MTNNKQYPWFLKIATTSKNLPIYRRSVVASNQTIGIRTAQISGNILLFVLFGFIGFAVVYWFNQPAVSDSYETGNFGHYLDDKPIKLYTTSWCPYCKNLRAYLDTKGVKYDDVDIELSNEGYTQFQELGGSSIPLIITSKLKIYGFDQNLLEQKVMPNLPVLTN